MNIYGLVLTLHLVVCVLGVGSSLTVGLLARSGAGKLVPANFFGSMTRLMSFSLIIVVLTGISLVALKDEGQFRHWYFRGVFFLTFLLGALAGTALRGASKMSNDPLESGQLQRLTRSMAAMAGVTAVIIFLLAAKPF